jgi:hypothetical protein
VKEEAADRVEDARIVLESLGFGAERSNERSALVLLALLRLHPDDAWPEAQAPPLGTRAIMDWIRDEYGVTYAPNTREKVRRFTLHQFVDAGLVVENPDDPARPVNSPKWCYQIRTEALAVIRAHGSDDYDRLLDDYLQAAPGGRVLYVGDADEKWAVFHEDELAALGVTVDKHGKMPDLVVYLPDQNWLVLLEAVASHGPVDGQRHSELSTMFSDSTAGLVYVSCFPSRAIMRKYLTLIAWETEVWCADDPTHLIHFNGERFLGPYE